MLLAVFETTLQAISRNCAVAIDDDRHADGGVEGDGER